MLNIPARGGLEGYSFSYTVHVPGDVNRAPHLITSALVSVFQPLYRISFSAPETYDLPL
jgi:hypothetical protein